MNYKPIVQTTVNKISPMHCAFYDNEKLFRRVHFLTYNVCIFTF